MWQAELRQEGWGGVAQQIAVVVYYSSIEKLLWFIVRLFINFVIVWLPFYLI